MSKRDQNLLKDRGTAIRLVINAEKDQLERPFYTGILGDGINGTIAVIKIGQIILSPSVLEMILNDQLQEPGNA